jgi:glutamate dehydrogenase (NAD(P)+)
VAAHKTVVGYGGATPLPGDEILVLDVDVLVPAALGEVITKHNAGDVRAKIICEGANHPLTPDADEVLFKKDVTILPDIFANAGGVTVSYMEWVQNIQQYRWDEDRVNAELKKIMAAAYRDLRAMQQQLGCDLRTAAFGLAISRVAQATKLRGLG